MRVLATLSVLAAIICTVWAGCCSPLQWEAQEFGFDSESGPGTSFVSISFDSQNSQARVQKLDSLFGPKPPKVLLTQLSKFEPSVKAYRLYTVYPNGTCFYSQGSPVGRACFPPGESSIWSYNMFDTPVSTYNYQLNAVGFVEVTTTQKSCVPLKVISTSYQDKMVIMTSEATYANWNTGIKDPSIFNTPPNCVPGNPEVEPIEPILMRRFKSLKDY